MQNPRPKKRRTRLQRNGGSFANCKSKRISRGSLRDAPSDRSRGERKKISLEETPLPIEQGGEET